MNARVIKRMFREMQDEMPPRTPLELDYLAKPRNEEARQVLALAGTLDGVPLSDAAREFLPMLKRQFEELALDCQALDRPGTREKTRAWLNAARDVLA